MPRCGSDAHENGAYSQERRASPRSVSRSVLYWKPEERKLTRVRPEDDECRPSTRRRRPSAEVSTRGKRVLSSAPNTRWL
jgi:hypothetical protein